jgi:hypothetical protein
MMNLKKITLVLVSLCLIYTINITAVKDTKYHHVLTIQPPDLESDAYFGYSIACDESYIVVGEVWRKVEGKYHAGKAYIFDSDGNLKAELQSPTPLIEARFGRSVAIKGDIVVIGEPLAGVDEIDYGPGKVHIFDVDGNLQATITPPEPNRLGRFGIVVAINGDKLVVSESGDNFGEFTHAGKVHIYDLEGNLLTAIKSPEPFEGGGSGGNFGFSLACNNYIIVVGEVHTTVDDKYGAGRVFVFNFDGDLLASLQSPEPQSEGGFGQSVAVIGELILVGEHYAEVEGKSRAGKVHVFDLEGVLLYTLQSPEPSETALFGRKVAVSDSLIVIGERGADGESADEGLVHLYDLDGNWVATLKSPSPYPNGEFGSYVTFSGDAIVVAERSSVIGEYKAGQVHLYRFGSAVEVQEPVEETTSETEKPETEPRGGIPGYPLWSILAALGVYYLIKETAK